MDIGSLVGKERLWTIEAGLPVKSYNPVIAEAAYQSEFGQRGPYLDIDGRVVIPHIVEKKPFIPQIIFHPQYLATKYTGHLH